MKYTTGVAAAAFAFIRPALAHYRFTSFVTPNGTVTGEYEYVRQNTNYNSPVTNLTSDDMRCNVGGLESGNTTSTYSVNAGDTVGFKLDQAAYHPGPFDFYLGQVPSGSTAATWDGSGSSWFKIYEIGAIIGDGTFAFNETIDQVTFELPSTIQDGDYLLRAEQIGLHIVDAPQFYISCAQITVSGGGSATPSTVEIPGYLSANDSSLTIDIYYPVPTAYTNPGPTVFTDDSVSSGSSSASSATATATSVVSSSAGASSVSSAASATAVSSVASFAVVPSAATLTSAAAATSAAVATLVVLSTETYECYDPDYSTSYISYLTVDATAYSSITSSASSVAATTTNEAVAASSAADSVETLTELYSCYDPDASTAFTSCSTYFSTVDAASASTAAANTEVASSIAATSVVTTSIAITTSVSVTATVQTTSVVTSSAPLTTAVTSSDVEDAVYTTVYATIVETIATTIYDTIYETMSPVTTSIATTSLVSSAAATTSVAAASTAVLTAEFSLTTDTYECYDPDASTSFTSYSTVTVTSTVTSSAAEASASVAPSSDDDTAVTETYECYDPDASTSFVSYSALSTSAATFTGASASASATNVLLVDASSASFAVTTSTSAGLSTVTGLSTDTYNSCYDEYNQCVDELNEASNTGSNIDMSTCASTRTSCLAAISRRMLRRSLSSHARFTH